MKKIIISLVSAAAVLFAAMALASPSSVFTWTAPTNYENGGVIGVDDTLTYHLYCGSTQGGPYPYDKVFNTPSPSTEDMAFCVNGAPGTYYMVATTISSLYGSESGYSNEVFRTYSTIDLGQVPLPPVLLQVQ